MGSKEDLELLQKIQVDRVDSQQPLGRFLVLLFRSFEQDLISRLNESGFTNIGPSDLNVLRFVKPNGSTATEIAELLGVTKQMVSKSVSAIETKGYLARKPNEQDGRSQLIVFTRKGQRLILTSIDLIQEIEKKYQRKIGVRKFDELKATLTELLNLYNNQKD